MKELLSKLTLHGRTVWEEETQALWCNWTCAGITVRFTGSRLKAKLSVLADKMPVLPGSPPSPDFFPHIGVVTDGETLVNRQDITADGWYDLWQGEQGEHTLRLVKLSENSRGKLGILALECDGEILPCDAEKKPVIEIVGDSITCAFGSESADNSPEFLCSEENGWTSYGALAARELGCEWRQICVSGISVCRPEHPMFPMASMDEIYRFTDQLFDEKRGKAPADFDFKSNPADIVVLNLGTNDSNAIRFCPDFGKYAAMEDWFRDHYRAFLAQLRQLNGPDTSIVCTLGSMDYYLYDQILQAVAQYKAETGDEKIYAFKFAGINMMTEGYGAMAHPSAKTQERMGRELAYRLRELGIC